MTTRPVPPSPVSTLATPSSAYGVAIVANHQSGLSIVDIADRSAPQVVGTLSTYRNAGLSTNGLAVAGNLVYTVDANG